MKTKGFVKRLTAFTTSVVMIASCVAMSSLYASADDSWVLTEGVNATLNSDGVFTVSGNGAIPDYGTASARPYNSIVGTPTSVVIEDGITGIGKMALANFNAATKIDVAKSVTTIGQQAFNMCNNENLVIDIKGEVASVGTRAFNSVKNTAKIYVYDQETYNAVYAALTTTQKNKGMLVLNSEGGGVDLTPQKEALSNLIDEVEKNYPEWFYTEESYKDLKDALKNAKAKLERKDVTAEELTEANRSISSSVNPGLFSALVSKLKSEVDEAKALNTSAYTASSVAALNKAIEAAEAYDKETDKVQQKFEEVVAALKAASTVVADDVEIGLKNKASAEKIAEFQSHHAKAATSSAESSYTPESWAKYEPVLEKYEALYSVRTTDATNTQIDNAIKDLDEAAKKLEKIPLKLDEYNAAKKAVEDILNANDSPYTTGSLASVKAVYDNNTYEDENGEIPDNITQSLIDRSTEILKNVIDPKSESYRLALKGNVTNLAALVEEGKALIESDYTSDSWKTFTEQMAAAEALVNDPDNAGVDAIEAAEEAVRKAIDTLVINYSNSNGEEVPAIGYIQKGGVTLVIDKGTADDELAGTATIRVVFDCAADVNFNPWAAIEIKALVDGVESYEKFEGTDNTETNGTKDWSVELALTNPIASGNSYELSGFTYAWNGAADYVYAITKVEYLDADGKVLKTVSGANDNAKLDEFNETVDAAKALIESGNYTDDSIKALEEAVAKADALLTESNGKPLPSKMPEIVEAIEAAKNTLELKPADYTAVDEAIANVPEDLSVYTEESVKALNDAIDAVVRDKDITEQATVDGYAQAINDAISALEYIAADYTKVDEAIAKVPADLSIYTDETAAAVTAAVEAVDRTKNITEQETVDGYAKAIEDAIAALVEKPTEATTGEPITNEPTGDVTTGSDDQPTTKAPTGGKDTTKAPSTTVAPTTTAPAKGNNGSATDKPVNTGAQAAVGLSAFLAAAAIGLVALKKRNK